MRNAGLLLALLAVGAAVLAQGCMLAAVGAGAAGTVAYMKGDLESVESEDIQTVFEAAKKAAEELKLSVVEASKDALSAKIVARDAQDKKITIRLKAVSAQSTELSIRVGTFGSETKSRLIYNTIKDNLEQG